MGDFLMFDASGKSINDIGKYDDCHKIEGSHYCLMRMNVVGNFSFPLKEMVMGACVPARCTVNDMVTVYGEFFGAIVALANRSANGTLHFNVNTRAYCDSKGWILLHPLAFRV